MKITFTGRQVELAPAQLKKLEARFAKIGKLLDGRRECEGHVILSHERHLHHAEATVNYYGHQLAGLGSSEDLFTAIHAAAEKLEKQAVKARTKWRDNQANAAQGRFGSGSRAGAAGGSRSRRQRVHRVNNHENRKPMTVEEAILEMDRKKDYLVYRDAKTDRVSVLMRRKDGTLRSGRRIAVLENAEKEGRAVARRDPQTRVGCDHRLERVGEGFRPEIPGGPRLLCSG